jgi:hypothetical protein
MPIPANDNDATTGFLWRAVRDRSAFADVLELPPATIDFDDPAVLLRLLEIGNVDPPLRATDRARRGFPYSNRAELAAQSANSGPITAGGVCVARTRSGRWRP